MAKKPLFTRTTISVPAELKRRMDKVTEDVNWSALACSAFQDKLAEIATRKKEKDMSDVIERLRASKKRNDNERAVAGRLAGETWVKDFAEVAEVKRLQDCWDSTQEHDRWCLFDTEANGASNAYSAAERLVFTVKPDNDGDRAAASDFWDTLLGDDGIDQADAAFMEAFYEGALDLWDQIKDEI